MSNLKEIVIKTESGGFEYLDVHSYEESLDMVTYGSAYDEAISGALRSNMRGHRTSYEISYNKCLQPEQFLSVCNNIAQDMIGGLAFLMIGRSTTNMIKVVPSGDFAHRVQYTNQMGRYVPKITLTSFEIFDSVPVGVETIDWRYIDEGVIDSFDYLSLDDQGILNEEEYGTIG